MSYDFVCFFRRGGEVGFLDFPPSNKNYRMKYSAPDHGINP